jgi:RNA polymerase sigma factor (sigma-70 family)
MSKRKGRKRKVKVDQLLKLMARASYEATKYGRLVNTPEDAAQEYAARLLEGRHQRATVPQAMLDIVHANTGKPVMPGYEQKKNMFLAMPVDSERITTGHNPTNKINQRIFLSQAIAKLDERSQVILSMYLEGFTLKEIADEYGCTMSYVQQLWKKAVIDIRDLIA